MQPVATLVCFHAHPDDEAIATGGTMAMAAAELAATPNVYESTINRDHIRRLMEQAADFDGDDETGTNFDTTNFGTPESEITTTVDVSEIVDLKRKAMAAHASQISETSWFL